MSGEAAPVYSVVGRSSPGGEAELDLFGVSLAIDAGAQRDLVRPGPAELLCGALAACLLKNVERFSTTLPFVYRAARVTVQAERQDSPPRFTRFTYRLELVTDEPERRVSLLQRNIERFGTVSGTLGQAAEVVGEVVAVEALNG
ncbi:OsmC family protein [Myxococcota bacterium]|nr:OsmC family protein [Myxococcota bacterium]